MARTKRANWKYTGVRAAIREALVHKASESNDRNGTATSVKVPVRAASSEAHSTLTIFDTFAPPIWSGGDQFEASLIRRPRASRD